MGSSKGKHGSKTEGQGIDPIAHARSRRPPQALALEPRIMFDAAGAVTLADPSFQQEGSPAVAETDPLADALSTHELPVPGSVPTSGNNVGVNLERDATLANSADVDTLFIVQGGGVKLATPADPARQEIVFIEGNVADLDTLLAGIDSTKEVHVLDAGRDGLQEISAVLAGRSDVDAIHILSHGNSGSLQLGTAVLDQAALQNNADLLAAIGASLKPDADIYLYACNLAAGNGSQFIADLAVMTGADIAASDDLTGHSDLGGDWDLEVVQGQVDSPALIDARTSSLYHDVLDLSNVTVNFGTKGNFTSKGGTSAAGDVAYKVSGNSSYTMNVNGTSRGVISYDAGYIVIDPLAADETSVTVTFKDGNLFTPSSLDIANYAAYFPAQTLIFKGYNASNVQVGSTQYQTVGKGFAYATANFTGLTDITKLVVTASTNSNTIHYITFDNFKFSSIKAAVTAPTTTVSTASLSADTGTSSTDFITNTASQTISGTLSSNLASGESVEVSFNNGSTWSNASSFSVGSSSWSTTTTLSGSSTFLARVTNSGGSSTSFSQSYTLDTSAPSAPSTPDLSSGTDSGTSSTDDVTNDTTPTFTGTAEANATVKLYDTDGTTLLGSTTADGSGNWSITSSTLSAGSHSVTVKATDTAGNTSSASSSLAITIDDTAPSTPAAPDMSGGTDSGTSSTDNITSDTTPTFLGTAEANSTVTLYDTDGSTVLGTTTANGVGKWTITSSALSAGAHTLTVKSSDSAGNTSSASSSLSVTIDTTAPTTTVSSSAFSADTGSSSTDFITNTAAQTISGTLSANVASGEVVQVSLDNGGTWSDASTTVGQNTWSLSGQTLSGSDTLQVRVVDAAGNAGTAATQAYVLDTTAPTTTISTSAFSADTGSSSTDFITKTAAQTISGTLSANLASGETVEVSLDNGSTWASASATVGQNTWSLSGQTLSGSDTLKVRVTDTAGNSGTTASQAYVLDTSTPTTTVSSVAFSADTGSSSSDFITKTAAQTLSGSLSANMASGELVEVSLDNGSTWTTASTTVGQSTWSLSGVTLTSSDTLKVRVADTAGNTGTATSQAYTLDTTAPTATVSLNDSALKVGETATVTITFSEAVTGFSNADLTVANGTLSTVSSGDGGITWTGTFTPTASTSDASNVITLDNTGVSDTAGNAGTGTTDSANYSIDTLRPTATIGLSDSALKAGETATVTITFSEAVSGLTNADLTVANGTLSSVSSSDGGTTWTATFTPSGSVEDASNVITLDNTGVADAAGNAGTSTTDSGNYSIDTLRPTATISLDDSALSVGEMATVTITFSEAVSGFSNADLTVANGTLSSVSTSDGGVTWTASFTPTASIDDSSNVITLDNTGVADAAGNAGTGTTDSANYTIDSTRPTASISLSDSALKAGETATVTVTFSEAVTGFSNADLTLANGTLSTVSSSDGGITWTGTFTPTASIEDATNLITLDNTGVTDSAGNAGSGSTDSSNYSIDTLRPTASISLSDSALALGETATVTITFSEAVSGFTNADLTVANGSLSSVSSSDGGVTWTATFTPSASTQDATNVISLDNTGVSDANGNAGTGTTDSGNYSIDTARPTATLNLNDTALKAGETATLTVTFSEAVSGFSNADLTVANGSLGTLSSSDGGITWTGTFTPTASLEDTSNVFTLDNTGVMDAAGNAGTGNTDSGNYTIDTLRPTATVSLNDSALKAGETATLTITFSEAVSGLTGADLTVANGSVGSVSSSDGGVTWTTTFTPSASIEDASNLITLDNSGIADAAGNTGTGTTDSANYSIDTLRPTASISLSDSALSVGETATVTITFSEAVTGFSNADLTVANGKLSTVSSSDGGITWTGTFTPTASIDDASNLITLDNTGVSDAAGNAGIGTTDSANYSIDSTRPTATISLNDTALKAGDTATVTITFSEAVTGLTNADLTVANGTLSSVSSSDGGTTWTGTFTPTASIEDASNVISLDNTGIIDAAGNAGTGSTDSGNYAIDTVRPSATISLSDSALGIGETATVTFTFNEAVTGFTNADLTVANGKLSTVSSSDGGVTWTGTFTPTASLEDATNVVSLDNTGVSDAAGNTGTGSTDSGNFGIDTLRPSATVSLSDSALKAGETATLTLTFSEAVSGLTNADLSLVNGSLSTMTSSDGGITWTGTFTPTAGLEDASNLITLDNTGVSDASGNSGTGTTDSSNFSIDTIRPTASVTLSDSNLTAGETATLTIAFNEAVTGFSNADVSVEGGSLSTLTSSDGGVTWSATFTPTPSSRDDSNLISLDLTGVEDAAGNAGSGTVSSAVFVVDTNQAPVLADTELALIAIDEDAAAPSGAVGTAISSIVSLSSNVTDPDSGAVAGIALTALDSLQGEWYYSLNNGTSWAEVGSVSNSSALLLDAGSRLYFKPAADYNGSLAAAIEFRAWDGTTGDSGTKVDTGAGGGSSAFSSATDVASLQVSSINDSPVAASDTVTPVLVYEGVPFTLTLPAGLFTDIDAGDLLTLSASLTSGGALPGWLSFDPESGTFSGTPTGVDGSVIAIAVTATDRSGFSTLATLDIATLPAPVTTLPPVTTPVPTAPEPLPPATADQGTPLSGGLDAVGLGAGQGGSLGGVRSDGGTPILNAIAGMSRLPSNGSSGLSPGANAFATARPTGSDFVPGSAPGYFDTSSMTARVSTGPLLASEPPAIGAIEVGSPFSYQLPETTFFLPAGSSISYQAQRADGQPLPSWLKFDPATQTFTGIPPAGTSGELVIRVIARDENGKEASVVIKVKLSPGQGQGEAEEPTPSSGQPNGAEGAQAPDSAMTKTHPADASFAAQLHRAAQPSGSLESLWQDLMELFDDDQPDSGKHIG